MIERVLVCAMFFGGASAATAGETITPDAVVTGSVDAGLVISAVYEGPSATYLLMRSRSGNGGTQFVFHTAAPVSSGTLFMFNNGSQPVFWGDWAGNLVAAGSLKVGDTITTYNGGSGHPALQPGEGLYLYIRGRLPLAYWGHHGAVTFGNDKPMTAGYLAEFNNPESGASTDKKLLVNYQGGLWQGGAYSAAQFAPCGNYENAPVNDGGTGAYIATDAGVALDGTLMFDVVSHRWHQCVVAGPGAVGEWVQFKLGSSCP